MDCREGRPHVNSNRETLIEATGDDGWPKVGLLRRGIGRLTEDALHPITKLAELRDITGPLWSNVNIRTIDGAGWQAVRPLFCILEILEVREPRCGAKTARSRQPREPSLI